MCKYLNLTSAGRNLAVIFIFFFKYTNFSDHNIKVKIRKRMPLQSRSIKLILAAFLCSLSLSSTLLGTFSGELGINQNELIFPIQIQKAEQINVVIAFNSTGNDNAFLVFQFKHSNDTLIQQWGGLVSPKQKVLRLSQTTGNYILKLSRLDIFSVSFQVSIYLVQGCGDGVRQSSNQQCDNRNQTGCIGCIVQPGYKCVEDANLTSSCAPTKFQLITLSTLLLLLMYIGI